MSISEQVLEKLGNGFSISRMTEHDLLEVVEIEEDSGLSRWGWAAYYAELQGSNRDLMLVARAPKSKAPRVSHTLAGYIVARIGANELHINNVAVRERYRRQGIGLNLLDRILEEGRSRYYAAFLSSGAWFEFSKVLISLLLRRVNTRKARKPRPPMDKRMPAVSPEVSVCALSPI